MRTWSTLPTPPPQWGKMTGIPVDLSDGEINWTEVANKPTTFTPATHNHTFSTLSGIALASPIANQFLKFNGTSWINDAVEWTEVANKPTSFSPSTHNHDAANINSGIFAIARIPTGATATTVALGNHNHTFSTLTGVALASPIANQFLKFNGTSWINDAAEWTEVANKPATFTPATHTHTIANINSLQTSLNGKADLAGTNIFNGEQKIDREAGSGLSAVFRLLSGNIADSRAYNFVSQSNGNFIISETNDANNIAKVVLAYTRGGGAQLYCNGVIQIETTFRGAKIYNIPNTSVGLSSGELWRDANGFLRIV